VQFAHAFPAATKPSEAKANRSNRFILCLPSYPRDAAAGLVGIEGGAVTGVLNLESSAVEALDRRQRHGRQYHEASLLTALGRNDQSSRPSGSKVTIDAFEKKPAIVVRELGWAVPPGEQIALE
jgi:hypothetical protein